MTDSSRSNSGFILENPPTRWRRLGMQMQRGKAGSFDCRVTGDPCIVWDEAVDRYRMFYFALGDRGQCCNAQALSTSTGMGLPEGWAKAGPVDVENVEDYRGSTHKPFILMDPRKPNRAMLLDGSYWLFSATYCDGQKVIHVARSRSLAGPWRVQNEPVVRFGERSEFDGLHADSVTAWWLADRGEILIYYKGYPFEPQAQQSQAPLGSSLAAAVMKPGDTTARKLGPILRPDARAGHWAVGWVGPLQLLPAKKGWWGLMSASPTPPAPVSQERMMREPAPSMGGWAYTPEAWPVSGWRPLDRPIEHVDEIPQEAKDAGEGVNLWRHHALVLPTGEIAIYYNTGAYGQERMFAKLLLPG